MSSTLPPKLRVFPRMLGRRQGSKLYVDPSGGLVSRATIDIDARFVDNAWRQVNTITPDGGTPGQTLVGAYFDADAVFRLDTERIVGRGDEVGDCIVVTWALRADPALTFAELISFHGERGRTRTWHHFRNDALIGRTLLQETRVG
jgi:hypothetical protein